MGFGFPSTGLKFLWPKLGFWDVVLASDMSRYILLAQNSYWAQISLGCIIEKAEKVSLRDRSHGFFSLEYSSSFGYGRTEWWVGREMRAVISAIIAAVVRAAQIESDDRTAAGLDDSQRVHRWRWRRGRRLGMMRRIRSCGYYGHSWSFPDDSRIGTVTADGPVAVCQTASLAQETHRVISYGRHWSKRCSSRMATAWEEMRTWGDPSVLAQNFFNIFFAVKIKLMLKRATWNTKYVLPGNT